MKSSIYLERKPSDSTVRNIRTFYSWKNQSYFDNFLVYTLVYVYHKILGIKDNSNVLNWGLRMHFINLVNWILHMVTKKTISYKIQNLTEQKCIVTTSKRQIKKN